MNKVKVLNESVKKVVIEEAKSMENPRLAELIEGLVMSKGLKLRDAIKIIYTSWKQGSIEFLEPKPPLSLLSFAVGLRSLWFWTITVFIALTAVIVFYATTPPLIYIRHVLGAIFVLYLPGSMLIEALYPRGEDLEGLERLALSMGLSLALVPLIGLLLNYMPWGIRLAPVTLSLASFTEGMALIALARKYHYYLLGCAEGKRA